NVSSDEERDYIESILNQLRGQTQPIHILETVVDYVREEVVSRWQEVAELYGMNPDNVRPDESNLLQLNTSSSKYRRLQKRLRADNTMDKDTLLVEHTDQLLRRIARVNHTWRGADIAICVLQIWKVCTGSPSVTDWMDGPQREGWRKLVDYTQSVKTLRRQVRKQLAKGYQNFELEQVFAEVRPQSSIAEGLAVNALRMWAEHKQCTNCMVDFAQVKAALPDARPGPDGQLEVPFCQHPELTLFQHFWENRIRTSKGLNVYRFRKRYYAFYNHYDSYPSGLGSCLVDSIPTDQGEYRQWLNGKRSTAAEWHDQYEARISGKSNECAETPDYYFLPSFLAPIDDGMIEWVYTIDLDKEIFSIKNGAHFWLDRIPGDKWIQSLVYESGEEDEVIAVPDKVPAESIANPAIDNSVPGRGGMTAKYDRNSHLLLQKRTVSPKELAAIPPTRWHVAILYRLLFTMLRGSLIAQLSINLLQWQPDDFAFREIAYAALCIAAGGKYTTLLPPARVQCEDRSPFGFIPSRKTTQAAKEYGQQRDDQRDEVGKKGSHDLPTFFGQLVSGSHLEGEPLGSSPDSTVYWFNGALVVLISRLYETGALEEGIDFVVRYHQIHSPDAAINAVLFSIEHLAFVKSFPDGRVQHTSIMPLFEIDSHRSLDAQNRYTKSHLEYVARTNHRVERYTDEEAGEYDLDSPNTPFASHITDLAYVRGRSTATFDALYHFFEAINRGRMPSTKLHQGCFPNEIYTTIIDHVVDLETRNACME
ncbi:MAG: hypothetical protein Q9181_007887, partial [Wetmoreana brouardii]